MHRLRWTAFLDQLPTDERISALDLARDMNTSFPSTFVDRVQSQDIHDLLTKLEIFTESKCKSCPTFAFWNSYLELVEILMLFIRATREGNWSLHMSSVRDMIPWYFAYDRVNYARYMPVYWMEMMNLDRSHPEILHSLQNGTFAVQQQTDHMFSKTACDQVIEQTCNRDSKTKGGLTGITLHKAAVHRWILSHHARAAIAKESFLMAAMDERSRGHKDLDKSRIQVDEAAVQSATKTITSMINPFACQDEELVNISTGSVASGEIQRDLLMAGQFGDDCFTEFVNERFITKKKDLFSSIKTQKLKTFSNLGKSSTTKLKQENIAIKASQNLIIRMLMVVKMRHIDLEEVLSYSLSPVPPSLGNYDGSMVKTNKAGLLHCLLKHVPNALVSTPPSAQTLIVACNCTNTGNSEHSKIFLVCSQTRS